VTADVWSATSFTELRRDGIAVDRWNLLNAGAKKPRTTYVGDCLESTEGPVIAATDYMRAFADQIRAWVPRRYLVLGTDGFGRSDARERLRHFFEVDRNWITVAALKALCDEGTVPAKTVTDAMAKYGLDGSKVAPWLC
jgi:pyruvate dehydrogenase E1 component